MRWLRGWRLGFDQRREVVPAAPSPGAVVVSGVVWSCPECQADLQDGGHNLWCPVCERAWSNSVITQLEADGE
jgi:hypothetical protein